MTTSTSDQSSVPVSTFPDLKLASPAPVIGDRAGAVSGQVMALVALTLGCLALGAYIGRDLAGGLGILLFIAGLACIFGLNIASAVRGDAVRTARNGEDTPRARGRGRGSGRVLSRSRRRSSSRRSPGSAPRACAICSPRQGGALAIVFIDEIDAIGRSRQGSAGITGANDEREQTLDQILTEMDRFESTEAFVVLGATNRPEILDQALLQPGRFHSGHGRRRPDQPGA